MNVEAESQRVPVEVSVEGDTFCCTSRKLDLTSIRVDPARVDPRVKFFKAASGVVSREQHSIAQHPKGGPIQWAAGDVVRSTNTQVFYTIDTADGSSGSPVLDAQNDVVALHRGWKPPDDVGTHIRAIVEFVEQPHLTSDKRGPAAWKPCGEAALPADGVVHSAIMFEGASVALSLPAGGTTAHALNMAREEFRRIDISSLWEGGTRMSSATLIRAISYEAKAGGPMAVLGGFVFDQRKKELTITASAPGGFVVTPEWASAETLVIGPNCVELDQPSGHPLNDVRVLDLRRASSVLRVAPGSFAGLGIERILVGGW
jgi:hypothetical protein